jgi:hypothetical protein
MLNKEKDNMNKRLGKQICIFAAAWFSVSVVVSGCHCVARTYNVSKPEPVNVKAMPPAPIPETVPTRSSSDSIWIKGAWEWNSATNAWDWKSGSWMVPPNNYIWVDATYEHQSETTVVYTPGHWEQDPNAKVDKPASHKKPHQTHNKASNQKSDHQGHVSVDLSVNVKADDKKAHEKKADDNKADDKKADDKKADDKKADDKKADDKKVADKKAEDSSGAKTVYNNNTQRKPEAGDTGSSYQQSDKNKVIDLTPPKDKGKDTADASSDKKADKSKASDRQAKDKDADASSDKKADKSKASDRQAKDKDADASSDKKADKSKASDRQAKDTDTDASSDEKADKSKASDRQAKEPSEKKHPPDKAGNRTSN